MLFKKCGAWRQPNQSALGDAGNSDKDRYRQLVATPLEIVSVSGFPICKRGMRDLDGLLVAGDTNYNVSNWGIIRKCSIIEFDDDQIWAALLQHQSEFRPMSPFTETREQFKERNPIGYDECMAGMERVLYKALGYL